MNVDGARVGPADGGGVTGELDDTAVGITNSDGENDDAEKGGELFVTDDGVTDTIIGAVVGPDCGEIVDSCTPLETLNATKILKTRNSKLYSNLISN